MAHHRAMFYRVDYVLVLLAVGAVAAVLLAGRAARIEPQRLARGYLVAVAVTVVIRAMLFIALFGIGVSWVPMTVFLVAGDVSTLLLGAVYGIAAVAVLRGGFAAVLGAPQLRVALCLSVAVGFSIAGIGKTFALDFMLDFFAQSHYSKSFLFAIMATEVLGGVMILLPWRGATVAAAGGLAIVVFGAIYTHWHNGEPFDYSRDAVVMLFRLAPIAVICVGSRWTVAGAVVCCAVAVAGSALVRIAPQPADDFAFFVGSWQCSGKPAGAGAALQADVHIERHGGGRWLLLRRDDHPPDTTHTLAEWSRDRTGLIASVQDDRGGLGIYHSAGWQGAKLIWDGQDLGGGLEQRFEYDRIDDVSFELHHDTRDASGWHRLTTLTCIH